jgi:cell fate (sporulation/competence/biofilm development) regulator YlbF (YheA/YmcA/DUF963 family)
MANQLEKMVSDLQKYKTWKSRLDAVMEATEGATTMQQVQDRIDAMDQLTHVRCMVGLLEYKIGKLQAA